MTHDLPSRGPRRMNGMGKLLAQARVLQTSPGPETKMLEDLHAVKGELQRLRAFEAKHRVMVRYVEVYRERVKDLPEGHPVRQMVTDLLDSFDKVLLA